MNVRRVFVQEFGFFRGFDFCPPFLLSSLSLALSCFTGSFQARVKYVFLPRRWYIRAKAPEGDVNSNLTRCYPRELGEFGSRNDAFNDPARRHSGLLACLLADV